MVLYTSPPLYPFHPVTTVDPMAFLFTRFLQDDHYKVGLQSDLHYCSKSQDIRLYEESQETTVYTKSSFPFQDAGWSVSKDCYNFTRGRRLFGPTSARLAACLFTQPSNQTNRDGFLFPALLLITLQYHYHNHLTDFTHTHTHTHTSSSLVVDQLPSSLRPGCISPYITELEIPV